MDYKIHHALGLLHHRLGELPAAEEAFRTALRYAPRHVPSATKLGVVLLESDRLQEAADSFRYALGLSPQNTAALDGLRAVDEVEP